MKKEDFRGLDDADARRRLDEVSEQLFRLKFQMAMGSTDSLGKYRKARKDRARLLTLLREREIAAARTPAAAQGVR